VYKDYLAAVVVAEAAAVAAVVVAAVVVAAAAGRPEDDVLAGGISQWHDVAQRWLWQQSAPVSGLLRHSFCWP
jgi:hypothetical protein